MRLDAERRIRGKVVEPLEVFPRLAFAVLHPDTESISADIAALDHLERNGAVADDRSPFWIGVVAQRDLRLQSDLATPEHKLLAGGRVCGEGEFVDAVVE